jgi:hypothetical protein
MDEPCLAPFDEHTLLSLATDASATGLGAVLLQHGRPVLYAACSLTDAEKRYSTIEKEGFSLLSSPYDAVTSTCTAEQFAS